MKATPSATELATASAFQPGLQQLIERGILSRAQLEGAVFANDVVRAVSRGDVTPDQADTIGQMLGVRAA